MALSAGYFVFNIFRLSLAKYNAGVIVYTDLMKYILRQVKMIIRLFLSYRFQ